MMYGYGTWGVWGWVAMGIVMLLFWGGVAALIVVLVRGARGGWGGGGYYPPAGPSPDDPERILGQRFARGEIDEAEYKARLEALRRRP
ncbi:SHOCT domain-containing protein [Sinomonas sp. JGH33]|uniref:SHOCT domain-containing protein n=1 Tax=Sinomonas terricola TaxID=3110330 RepID=A0ABU5TBU2_9MICC|nr:SHOCT domain-containing protein [Sinomonas sp. JGH33]MEA5457120.1 SHOCT domain-containing protein [Sinomonas sp. JGH33]